MLVRGVEHCQEYRYVRGVEPESADGVEDPWGESVPPAVEDPLPLPPRLAGLAELTGPLELSAGEAFVHPGPEDLPEVAALVAAGWRVAEGSPMWSFLPAVWPVAHRCWVRDRLPRFSRTTSERGARVIIPWTQEVVEDSRRHDVDVLARVGLSAPPPGRIWLVRSPWPSIGVRPVLSLILARSQERGGQVTLDARLVESAREVLGWDEERIWAWWPGERGEVARAWRVAGRTGEDVADLVVARISPELLAAYAQRGLDERQAVAWSAVVRGDGGQGLEEAVCWAELGLAPEHLDHALTRMGPAEVRRWRSEGFDLDAIRNLGGLPLAHAIAWRDAGIPTLEVRALLHADPTLTPSEARRFDDLAIAPQERRRWVEYGFDADTARAWKDLDVLPNEARVWRADGHDPTSAASLLSEAPAGTPRIPTGNYGWSIGGDVLTSTAHDEPLDFTDPKVRRAIHYSIDDPPGTRGSHAERARGGPTVPSS